MPTFDDLVKAGGKPDASAPSGPTYDDLIRAGGTPNEPGMLDRIGGALSSAGDAANDILRLGLQGATKRFSDEGVGLLESTFPRLALGPGEFFDPSVPTPEAKSYAEARDAERAAIEQSRANLPRGVGTGVEIAGDILTDVATGGAGNTYKGAAAMGALSGLGASEADLTKGDVGGAARDTALGAGLSVAGKAVGDKLGEGYGRVRDWVIQRAQRGQAAARELAEAQAADLVGKQVQQARSAAGSAASNARNAVENIEGIVLPVENVRRTVGEARDAALGQIDALDDAIEAAEARARAMGIDLEDLGAGRRGEFLAKGGRLDKAQKAAASLQALRSAREDVVDQYKELLARGADDAFDVDYGALREAQGALRADPRFESLKANVLKNSLNDFDRVAADAVAKREAFRQALSSQSADEAAMAENLLSGREFRNQLGQRLQRYGSPLVGSALGAGAGAAVGIATGGDPADMALYALGGAGVRPALQSFKRLAQQPATRNAVWSGIEWLARTAPESFGKYAGAVTSALARGPEALKAMDKVLRDTDPEWRQLREQQEKQAASQ